MVREMMDWVKDEWRIRGGGWGRGLGKNTSLAHHTGTPCPGASTS